ncbi:hypothetical protein HMPREF9004_0257 [Schaalia cardiffensis F0333]|uniref:Uncharacterized protein n=1 Tax=Schaalia cardiffensis F0333 TaxID=888050 RepID=N6X6B7_9ACTO|nr:hypothetical protein HMPREF9004_0257 [Schaalia cardiffensis F0333]
MRAANSRETEGEHGGAHPRKRIAPARVVSARAAAAHSSAQKRSSPIGKYPE